MLYFCPAILRPVKDCKWLLEATSTVNRQAWPSNSKQWQALAKIVSIVILEAAQDLGAWSGSGTVPALHFHDVVLRSMFGVVAFDRSCFFAKHHGRNLETHSPRSIRVSAVQYSVLCLWPQKSKNHRMLSLRKEGQQRSCSVRDVLSRGERAGCLTTWECR